MFASSSQKATKGRSELLVSSYSKDNLTLLTCIWLFVGKTEKLIEKQRDYLFSK